MRKLISSLSLIVFCVGCGGPAEKAVPSTKGDSPKGVGAAVVTPSGGEPADTPMLQSGPVNVVFPKDFNSVTLRGKVTKEQKAVYIVPLTAGDILSVRIVESNANNDVVFSIMSPFDHSLVGEEGSDYDTKWEAKLAETGDFTITVSAIESESSDFTMEIEVK